MSFRRQVAIPGVLDVNYANLRIALAQGAIAGSVQFDIDQTVHEVRRPTWFGLSEEVTVTFDVLVTAWSETDKGTVDDFFDYFIKKFIEYPNRPDFYGNFVHQYQMRIWNWCRRGK